MTTTPPLEIIHFYTLGICTSRFMHHEAQPADGGCSHVLPPTEGHQPMREIAEHINNYALAFAFDHAEPIEATSDNIYSLMVDAGCFLDMAHVPDEGRWCYLPKWALAKLRDSELFAAFGSADKPIAGFDVYQNPDTNGNLMLVGRRDGWAYSDSIVTTETGRVFTHKIETNGKYKPHFATIDLSALRCPRCDGTPD
jgi:hypothetical protein